jgi:type IV pilus assembly protein PilF
MIRWTLMQPSFSLHSFISQCISFICIISLLFACGASKQNKKDLHEAGYHYKLAYGHFFENKDGESALQEILLSLKFFEADPHTHLLAGLIFSGRNKYLKAMNHYKRALELDPKFYEVKNNLGTIYLALGQWERAIILFTGLIKVLEYRTPAMGHNNLGWAYYKLGKIALAKRSFLTAIQLNPRLCPPYNNVGLIYLEEKDLMNAQRFLERGIKRCPRYAEPYLHLGKTHLRQRQLLEANKYLQQCKKLSPDTSLGIRCEQMLIKIQ